MGASGDDICTPEDESGHIDEVLRPLYSSGGDVMAAMYGLLAAFPVMFGCAGYVLVSHPGTNETGASRRLGK